MKPNLVTDVYMTTEHKRKERKAKVNFSMVVNKVLVGALVLASVATSAAPVHAESLADKVNREIDKAAGQKSQNTITQNYAVTVESAIYNIKSTVKAIEEMRSKGEITQEVLSKLATEITDLEKAVKVSGKTTPNEVVQVLKDVETVLNGTKGVGATKAQAALIAAKFSLGVGTKIQEEYKQTQAKNSGVVKLTDIANHWAKENIDSLVQRGAIAGYTDGTFKPNQTISYSEFLKIALYSATTPQSKGDGSHWASGAFQDAERLHVLKPGEVPKSKWNEPINRYEMTRIMTRIVENIQGEKPAGTDGIVNIMPDYDKVSQKQAFKYYVEQAYMKGLIAGQSQGVFNGDANGTRAEAATMVIRIIEVGKRVQVDTSKPIQGSGILNWNNPDRPNAKAGDTFVKPDGTKVVLKVGPSGVLGEGQGVAVDLGRSRKNGTLLQDGGIGNAAWGYDGQPYTVDPATGSGFFKDDWGKIYKHYYNEAMKIQNPKEGQKVGPWVKYHEGGWTWMGPIFS